MELDRYYIDLNEVLRVKNQKQVVISQVIKNIIIDLKMDEGEKITISGTREEWELFLNNTYYKILEMGN